MRDRGLPLTCNSNAALGLLLAVAALQMAGADGVQYRATDMQFVNRLTARMDAAEARLQEIESDLAAGDVTSSHELRAQSDSLKRGSGGQQIKAAPAARAEGAELRVSERLRHKNRAVNSDPDGLGRIKIRLGILKEDMHKARKRLLAHELTHVVQQRSGTKVKGLNRPQAEATVQDIEQRLAELSAALQRTDR